MMERLKKALITGFILFVLVFLCLHMFVSIRGKDILSQKLEETFRRNVKIGSLSTSFPFNVFIRKIEVEGLFKIDELIAGRGLIDIFSKDFNLSFLKVVKPNITIERNPLEPDVKAAAGQPVATVPAPVPQENVVEKLEEATAQESLSADLGALASLPQNYLTRVSIGRLIVYEGTVNFIDRTVGDKVIASKIEHINIKVDNLNFTGRGTQITSFDVKGVIPWREGVDKGKIEAEGWINFNKKDMQATIKIEDIDGVYLSPYYSAWVDLEKVRIEKANLNFNSNIHGLNNNITAECHLELTDIVRKERPPEEPAERAEKIASAVIDMFRTLDQGRIVLDFTIRTKMDRPEFGFGNIKMAVKDKLAKARNGSAKGAQEFFLLPAKLIEGVVKGATDISRAMIDGTFAVGNEIKKSVEQSFKKEAN